MKEHGGSYEEVRTNERMREMGGRKEYEEEGKKKKVKRRKKIRRKQKYTDRERKSRNEMFICFIERDTKYRSLI